MRRWSASARSASPNAAHGVRQPALAASAKLARPGADCGQAATALPFLGAGASGNFGGDLGADMGEDIGTQHARFTLAGAMLHDPPLVERVLCAPPEERQPEMQ